MVNLPPSPRWPVKIAEPVEEELNETSKMIDDSPICLPNHQHPIICFSPICPHSCDEGEGTCLSTDGGVGVGIGFYMGFEWVSYGVSKC